MHGNGIQFHNDILDEALEMAKAEGKYVFIDTYAPWCAPCKRMNKVFTDPAVSDLYNDKFINVKINMDGSLGKQMLIKYDVIWLPTLLILDQDGNIKYKVDKELKADGLIKMANDALDPSFRFYSAPAYSKSPVVNTRKKTTPVSKPSTPVIQEAPIDDVELGVKDVPNTPEKILYVYNEGETSNNPEILYHEAYLQMQLMDPKMFEVADKYLSTQTNWATEKNVKFIFDFVENVHSKYFKFFSNNLPLFSEYIDQERVLQNLQIMVYMRLNNGYPRPTLNESIELYELINKENGKEKAYHYYLQRLVVEKKYNEFVKNADYYLTNINPANLQIMHQSATARLNHGLKGLPKSLKQIDRALKTNAEHMQLMVLKCRVLHRLGKKSESKSLAKKVLKISETKGLDTIEITEFLTEIS